MPIETVGDIKICYERQGTGPRLLYISGTGADLRNRPGVFDGPLARAFDVLAFDQRGLGRTSKPDKPYTMSDYADDAARLMDHVGWRHARVLGISFGGMVAQELALRYPAKVDRLVLACAGGRGFQECLPSKLLRKNVFVVAGGGQHRARQDKRAAQKKRPGPGATDGHRGGNEEKRQPIPEHMARIAAPQRGRKGQTERPSQGGGNGASGYRRAQGSECEDR